ncbi:MAG: adenosylmethionine-8-amino-7-oxononanoate transaminase [Chthoniobacter sp.]|nr:adenosylmethionine-8-amino-7-oxononanoate transaminase [Chthoniobacter sp.]
MNAATRVAISADRAHTWHPFTPMREWCAPDHEPLVLLSGEGAVLRDSEGREYLDGNSSIWTNLHGHRHPKIDAAIRAQLDRVAHTSFLGFTNPPAAQLAAELVALWPAGTLTRVFFSDDGSTAIEVALKMALGHWRHRGKPERRQFVSFRGAYHGDTLGAASLGQIPTFRTASREGYEVVELADLSELEKVEPERVAAVVIEPLIQGAAGMQLWPSGMLRELRAWTEQHGVLLILDEVMTGFGRTGTMFACEQEGVVPDLIALAKGLTGGYLPLAATLTRERIFESFLSDPDEDRTLYYGHSYTANQLGCAAALASLEIFREEKVLASLQPKIARFSELLAELADLPHVFSIRQCGFIAGIEVRRTDGTPFPPADRVGAQVCRAARACGLLTRPIRDTIVLSPPNCVTDAQLTSACSAISAAVAEICHG